MHHNTLRNNEIHRTTLHYTTIQYNTIQYNTIQYIHTYIHTPDYTLCWRARAATSPELASNWTGPTRAIAAVRLLCPVNGQSRILLPALWTTERRHKSVQLVPLRLLRALQQRVFDADSFHQTRRSSPNPKEFSKLEGELTRCTCAKLGLSAFTSSSAPSRLAPTRDSPGTLQRLRE